MSPSVGQISIHLRTDFSLIPSLISVFTFKKLSTLLLLEASPCVSFVLNCCSCSVPSSGARYHLGRYTNLAFTAAACPLNFKALL